MKKAIMAGFTDHKSDDADEIEFLSFCFAMGLIFLCIACVIYLLVIDEKTIEVWLLVPITLAGEVITGTVTLIHAIKIDADVEKNDMDAVKARKTKGKRQGGILFVIFFIILLVSTILLSG